MALSIGSSATQLTLVNNYSIATRYTDRSSERLATSLRINRASDHPAGLIEAEQLHSDLVEISAQAEALDAQQRLFNIQESGRHVASSVLQDLRGMLVEASDGTFSTQQRTAIQLQIDSSLDAIDYLGSTTGFALPQSLEALREGGSANVVDGSPAEGAALIDQEQSSLNLARAAAGAYEKYTLDVDRQLSEARGVATASALSQLEDTDYAQESSNLIRGKILTEASVRLMALYHKLRSNQISNLFGSL